jgi:DNA-binding MarR family transcriptional regulator
MPRDDRRQATGAALDALRRIVRGLRLAAGSAEAATGLTAAQLFVLQVVHAHPGSSLTTVAAHTLTDRTSVRAVVDRLVERGLVERRPSAVDRRRVELVATPAAEAVLAHAPHPPTRRLLTGMEALTEAELRALARGVGALARTMGLDGEPAAMLFEERAPTRLPRRVPDRRGGHAPGVSTRAGRTS